MIITQNPNPIFPGKDLKEGRSEGLHLSQIYSDLETELYPNPSYLSKKNVVGAGSNTGSSTGNNAGSNPLWAEVGFLFEEALTLLPKVPASLILGHEIENLWETALTAAFRERAPLTIRPGEVELDGVIGSPDGINFSDYSLEEYKCTWKSVKTTPDQIWKWMVQTKGYCKMLDMTRVLFRVLYVMGDYKHSGPIYREFWLEFSQEEIDMNWEMLINHAVRKGWLTK